MIIDMLFYAFRQLVTEVPLIIVLIGCIVVSLIFWRRAPRPSLYVLVACVFTLALLFFYPFSWACVLAAGDQNVPGINMAFSIGWSVARAIATILLVIAAYIERRQA